MTVHDKAVVSRVLNWIHGDVCTFIVGKRDIQDKELPVQIVARHYYVEEPNGTGEDWLLQSDVLEQLELFKLDCDHIYLRRLGPFRRMHVRLTGVVQAYRNSQFHGDE